MRREPHVAYSPEEHVRVQLGIYETAGLADERVQCRFTITANLVSTNAPVLKTKALDALDRGCASIAINLASCPYVDSTGLGVLVTIGNAARRAGGGLTIERASADFRTLLGLTGIATLFTLSPQEPPR
jgi:anti-anti-sigma factor